ncbi:hypothetical protein C1645_808700 [Glomus cerebriforme]|uniref:F-box domain-containing protein n=1 Tax=Glomus cerebriforme TaxID=658196 RepID=A0A397SF11_9GLOM|nr:hypothetical protein C1645_808700 [Glomus cerebriforme]
MACSKIFLGNLPELLNEIMPYFQNDFSTLHSCVLVNKLWCRLAIPLLWEAPFSLKIPKNYHYIEIFLHNLNEEDKTQLNKIGINKNIFPTSTLFNYPGFIKCLKMVEIAYSIEKWIEIVRNSATQEQEQYSRQILPFKLEYLNLQLMINSSDLEKFLKNSENTFIKKLMIYYRIEEQSEDILSYIKKYIMKTKRVEYLAILSDVTDLFSLTDEVKEFESFNIQVQKYDDLYIKFYNFLKENY